MNDFPILITGADGQLGLSLKKTRPGWAGVVHYTDLDTLDICNRDALEAYLSKNAIKLCINAAAYTKVDQAESDAEKAKAINALAVESLAILCQQKDIPVIHFSTDYIYDNGLQRPLTEDDPSNPKSVYAATKLEGEQKLLVEHPDATVLRTSWVFSEFGHNFVRTMLRLAETRDTLTVVNDQTGSPTYAPDLATVVWAIAQAYTEGKATPGVYNYCNSGQTTWMDFAREIFDQTDLQMEVQPISTADFGAPAPRPGYSVLDCSKITETYAPDIRDWTDALRECLACIQTATKSKN